jgi:hypothetical protein
MSKRRWFTLAGFMLLIIAILYGGPFLSSLVDKNYRKKIDRNCIVSKAVVYLKKTHKSNTVHFKYQFNNIEYKNNEQDDLLFKKLNIGDTINILLDSTNPSASYILK